MDKKRATVPIAMYNLLVSKCNYGYKGQLENVLDWNFSGSQKTPVRDHLLPGLLSYSSSLFSKAVISYMVAPQI